MGYIEIKAAELPNFKGKRVALFPAAFDPTALPTPPNTTAQSTGPPETDVSPLKEPPPSS